MTRLIALAVLGLTFAASPASAAVYCKTVGVPKGCVARPGAVATQGVGAPGVELLHQALAWVLPEPAR
jgi:hypothetical protein